LIPKSLYEWTYETVELLCKAGQAESDRHDFKFDLPEPKNLTKICCAFANTFGGFVILGVRERDRHSFEITGLAPDKELYGEFLAKLRCEPEINILAPKLLAVPNSENLLYIVEVPRSSRSPHLPTIQGERAFWKRQGSSCVQMTLAEIRYQMSIYEDKREKLALLLIDLDHKLQSLSEQASLTDAAYTGDTFSFEIMDRVVAESYAILKEDVGIFRTLNTIRRILAALNTEKSQMLAIQTQSYDSRIKRKHIARYHELAKNNLAQVTALTEQIGRTIKDRFGIENPYR